VNFYAFAVLRKLVDQHILYHFKFVISAPVMSMNTLRVSSVILVVSEFIIGGRDKTVPFSSLNKA